MDCPSFVETQGFVYSYSLLMIAIAKNKEPLLIVLECIAGEHTFTLSNGHPILYGPRRLMSRFGTSHHLEQVYIEYMSRVPSNQTALLLLGVNQQVVGARQRRSP